MGDLFAPALEIKAHEALIYLSERQTGGRVLPYNKSMETLLSTAFSRRTVLLSSLGLVALLAAPGFAQTPVVNQTLPYPQTKKIEQTDDYFGTTTVSYAIRKNVVLAVFHFNVQSVDDQCYFHSGPRASCKIQTKSG